MADELCIESLYRSHGAAVLRRARQMLGDENDAREVLQELFTTLVQRPGCFEGRSSPMTYLYRATTNLCLNRLRNQRTRTRLLEERGDPMKRSVRTRALEEWLEVRERLALLPDDQANAVVYHYLDGMSQAEVAQVMGCSRRHVGNLLNRAQRQWSEQQQEEVPACPMP